MRKAISLLTCLTVLTGITGCADVKTVGATSGTDYKAIYRQAFEGFVSEAVEERTLGGKKQLLLKENFPNDLRRMTELIDSQAAAEGIGSSTSPVTRSITRERVKKISDSLNGKFNPAAFRAVDSAQLFAEGLLFNGAALTNTDFCIGTPERNTYEKIYLVGTLLKADCGLFSCFNNPNDALSWQVVRQTVPFLSADPTLRQAELAAVNWDLTKARSLANKAKGKRGFKAVDARIKDYETLKSRIERNRAATRANTAKWEKIDRERAARSRQAASALFLRELQTVSSTVNDVVRQNAQNELTTAIAIKSAGPIATNAVKTQAAPDTAINDREAYLTRLAAVRALKAAQLEWNGLWQVVQADLMPLYNAEKEGKSLRHQFAQDTASAKKALTARKAEFDALCKDKHHDEAVRRYLNAHPDQYDSIVINLSSEEKSVSAADLRARYKPFYEKQRRLGKDLPY